MIVTCVCGISTWYTARSRRECLVGATKLPRLVRSNYSLERSTLVWVLVIHGRLESRSKGKRDGDVGRNGETTLIRDSV